jgi:malate/lactate dehydrogenase
MKNLKAFKKLTASIAAVCFSAVLVFAAPVATISAHAEEATVEPSKSTREEYISYVYRIKDNKLYKCLYNYSTGNFIGDWIYVRDLD